MAVELDKDIWFPNPLESAVDDRPFAYGGDLSVERIDLGYAVGAFPFFSYSPDAIIEWWCPRSRFVIFPEEIHISHSMRQLIRSKKYTVYFNKDFDGVIDGCSKAKGRDNDVCCWLKGDIVDAYKRYHKEGHGVSIEVRDGDRLVGGLYGGMVGNCFAGESMFSLVPSASKLALIYLAWLIRDTGMVIDCHFETKHLRSMGGRYVTLEDFMRILNHEFTSPYGQDRITERKALMHNEQLLKDAYKYPVCKCCRIQIPDDTHNCCIIIARKTNEDRLIIGVFKLDLWMEGVERCNMFVDYDHEDLESILEYYSAYEFSEPEDIEYYKAHALIIKAREWGLAAGFASDNNFSLGRMILDNECPEADAIMDSVQIGRDGKYCKLVHRCYVDEMKKRLDKKIGKGKYEILIIEDLMGFSDADSEEENQNAGDDLPF